MMPGNEAPTANNSSAGWRDLIRTLCLSRSDWPDWPKAPWSWGGGGGGGGWGGYEHLPKPRSLGRCRPL